jgi:hypothetical protein
MRYPILTLVLALVVGIGAAGADEPPKTSPFGAVRWEGERAHVEVGGTTYELVAIDEFDLPAIVAFAKKAYEENWAKRIEEDLGEVLVGLGGTLGPTVNLLVRDTAAKVQRLERIPSTKENRKRLREARHAAEQAARGAAPQAPAATPVRVRREHATTIPADFATLPAIASGRQSLTAAQAAEDLDELEAVLETRFSYLRRRGVDYRMHLDAIRLASAKGTSVGDFALRLQAALARFGDGHSGVDGWESVPVGGFAPFLVAESDAGPIAFHRNRSGFVDPGHPVLETIDDVPLERWTEAAGRLVPDASPAYVRLRRLRALRHVALWRVLLGRPAQPTVTLGLSDGKGTSRASLSLPLAERRPTFGDWPVAATRVLDGGVGYWRVADMDGSEHGLAALHRDAAAVAGAERLVLDVRGNGGGDRNVSLRMLARLLPPTAGPKVANAGVYRLGPGEAADRPGGWLDDRRLYPLTDPRWLPEEKRAIDAFVARFKPEWELAPGEGSGLHVTVVTPEAGPRPKKIVVLLDGGCFSATDIFLGGIAATPGVTLVGTPSGGGSGRKRAFALTHSRLRIELSSMVSYRPDGRLFDGRGVEPDVVVVPAPTDLLGSTDRALERALELLAK